MYYKSSFLFFSFIFLKMLVVLLVTNKKKCVSLQKKEYEKIRNS